MSKEKIYNVEGKSLDDIFNEKVQALALQIEQKLNLKDGIIYKLKEALGFYADKGRFDYIGDDTIYVYVNDGGESATTALKKCEELENE